MPPELQKSNSETLSVQELAPLIPVPCCSLGHRFRNRCERDTLLGLRDKLGGFPGHVCGHVKVEGVRILIEASKTCSPS